MMQRAARFLPLAAKLGLKAYWRTTGIRLDVWANVAAVQSGSNIDPLTPARR